MRVDKVQVKHTFDWQGEQVELGLNTSFTAPQYDAFNAHIKDKYADQFTTEALSEIAEFLLKSWNLEDEAGIIPVKAGEIQARVPLMLLTRVVQEAQEAVNSGGVAKNA